MSSLSHDDDAVASAAPRDPPRGAEVRPFIPKDDRARPYPPGFTDWPLEQKNAWFAEEASRYRRRKQLEALDGRDDSDEVLSQPNGTGTDGDDVGPSRRRTPPVSGNGLDGRAEPPLRKMRIEWFDEAADTALSEPTKQLIEDLLDEEALSVIYGDSGSGKTFGTLDMAFHVASNRPWNGKKVAEGLVVYVAAEGGRRIKRRLAALRKRYSEEEAEPKPLLALVRYPIDLCSSDANLKELIALIRAAEQETDKKCVWLIVETLSRAMAGGDENSPVDMGRIVTAADRIRAEVGCHLTYVHHTGKDAARGARGHSLLRAATDTEIEVRADRMSVTKQRDMEAGLTIGLKLVDMDIGDDLEGNPVKSAVVEWTFECAKPTTAPSERAARRLALVDAYERLADGIEPSPGYDGERVRKVAIDAIRQEMANRGFLERNDNGQLAATARKNFQRAKEDNLALKPERFVESDGLFWRVRPDARVTRDTPMGCCHAVTLSRDATNTGPRDCHVTPVTQVVTQVGDRVGA